MNVKAHHNAPLHTEHPLHAERPLYKAFKTTLSAPRAATEVGLLSLGLFSLGLLSSHHRAEALSLVPVPLKALTERSTLVAEGEVVAQRVITREGRQGRPWAFTLSELKVERCWRVAKPLNTDQCPERVLVSQVGGALPPEQAEGRGAQPQLTLSVPGMPLLKAHQRGLLFLTAKRPEPTTQGSSGAELIYEQGASEEAQGNKLPLFVMTGGPQGWRAEGLDELQRELSAQGLITLMSPVSQPLTEPTTEPTTEPKVGDPALQHTKETTHGDAP